MKAESTIELLCYECHKATGISARAAFGASPYRLGEEAFLPILGVVVLGHCARCGLERSCINTLAGQLELERALLAEFPDPDGAMASELEQLGLGFDEDDPK